MWGQRMDVMWSGVSLSHIHHVHHFPAERYPPPRPAPPGHQEALSHFLSIETPGGQEGRDSFTRIKLSEGGLSEMNELTKVKPGRAIPVTRSPPWCDPRGVQLPRLQGSAVGAGRDVQASFWKAVEAQT